MLVKLERDQEALDSFDRALKLQPDFAKALYNKSACYALQGKAKLAIDHLDKAIRLDPSYRAEARANSDFDGLVEDDRFWDLIEGEEMGEPAIVAPRAPQGKSRSQSMPTQRQRRPVQ
jgi:tetratricopeptide (TPR) repeat protein